MSDSIEGRVLGRFVCGEPIAEGGMAEVFAATHVSSDQPAVVKVLSAPLAKDVTLVARFEREIEALVGVRSSHVPQLFDSGRLEDGRPYLTIERCHGDTLAARILRGPLPIADVIEVAAQLARALEAIHGAGFVHRDVKPDNVLLHEDSDGRLRVQLIDFGICAFLPTAMGRPTLSDPGSKIGTPGYMSPEQTLGIAVAEKSDLFSLGVTLYEALTGVMPFDVEVGADDALEPSLEAILARTRTHEPPPARALRDDCPMWLDALVGRLLSKLGKHRPASASEVCATVETERLAPPGSVQTRSLPRLRLEDLPAPLVGEAWWSGVPWAKGAALAAVIGLAGAAGYVALGDRPLDSAARYLEPVRAAALSVGDAATELTATPTSPAAR